MLCLKVLKYNNLSHKSLCNFCNVNIVCWECYLPSARRDLSWMMNNGKIHTNGSRQLSAVNAALLTTDFVYDANKKLRIRASFWYIKFVQNFRVCHARTNLSARERECGSSSPSLQMVVIKIDMCYRPYSALMVNASRGESWPVSRHSFNWQFALAPPRHSNSAVFFISLQELKFLIAHVTKTCIPKTFHTKCESDRMHSQQRALQIIILAGKLNYSNVFFVLLN